MANTVYKNNQETFMFADYWPKPTATYSIQQTGTNFDGTTMKSIFAVDPNNSSVVWQDDYIDDVWKARWYINYNSDNGVIEYADAYPAKSWQFWTGRRITHFQSGNEIFWGKEQKVGDVVEHPCTISFWKSTPFEAPTKGKQVVTFVNRYKSFTDVDGKKYNNVVEITYDQSWGGNASGARQWHANGIGIVQLSWRYNYADTDMINKPMTWKFENIDPIKS